MSGPAFRFSEPNPPNPIHEPTTPIPSLTKLRATGRT